MSYHNINSPIINSFLIDYLNPSAESFQCVNALENASFALASEIGKYLPQQTRVVNTISGYIDINTLGHIALLPILRASLPMLKPFQLCIRSQYVLFVSPCPIDTKQNNIINIDMHNFPNVDCYLILDTIIGSGSTIISVIHSLISYGVSEEKIIVASLMAATNGVQTILRNYKNITIISCYDKPHLNEEALCSIRKNDVGKRLYGV